MSRLVAGRAAAHGQASFPHHAPAHPRAGAWQMAVLGATFQLLLVLGIGLGSVVLARVGAATPARIFFLLAALAAAGATIRRSPWYYLTLTFWFWTLTPLFRRMVDYYVGFDPTSLMLATPNVMTVFMAGQVLRSPRLLGTREGRLGLLLALPLFYGMNVNLVLGEVVPGLAAAADWVAPLLYYFYLISLADRIEEAEPHIRIFLTFNLAIITLYGLQQYVAPNDWDIAWIRDSGLSELGGPLPYTIRLFSTMNMPGPLAAWISTALLLALHFRTKLMLVVLPMAGILLLLTLVRGAVGTMLLALCCAVLLGRAAVLWTVVKSLCVMVAVMGTIGAYVVSTDPDSSDRIVKRFSTVNELQYDVSAEDRRLTYERAPAMIDANPLGRGIAAIGRGAVAAGEGQVVIDAGPLAIYVALGWIGGTVYLGGILAVLGQTLAGARATGSAAALAAAAAALANIASLVLANAMGVQAAILWFCVGYANALSLSWRQRRIADASADARLERVA